MRRFGRRGEAREAELDEEIRSHFRMAVEDRVARGESRAAAERAVRREFGNVLEVKEVTRAAWGGLFWERLAQDVRYAVRSLKRTPAFTILAVLTLALGVGATTAVFTVVNGVLLRPLPFPDPDRLVLVEHSPPPSAFLPTPGMTDGDYVALRENGTLFERVTTFTNRPIALTGGGEPARLNAGVVTTEFFDVLGVPPLLGRGFAAGEDEPGRDDVVVLGDALWRSRFAADSSVMGATVTVDGVPKTVLGVMPPAFDFPDGAELWMPLAMRIDPGNSMIRSVVGRLKRDATLEQSHTAFSAFVQGLPHDGAGDDGVTVTRVQPLKAFFTRDIQPSLMMFVGAVAFVLLIACANVANLLLMRGAAREREITVRTALGAGRGRVVRQLLTESVVIALLGGAAGAALAYAGVQVLLALAPGGRIPRTESIHVDAAVLAFTLLASLVSALAFGLLPSLYATRGDLRGALNIGGRTTFRDGGRARSVLSLAQIAVALVLLTGAGLMLRSFRNLRAVELGFAPEHVLTLTVDLPAHTYESSAEMHDVHDRVLAGLSTLPAASAAGAVNWLPLDRWVLSGDFAAEGVHDPNLSYWADKVGVSPDYFRAMGIRVLRGRAFTAADGPGAPAVAIVSRSLAERIWPAGDAIGRRLAVTPQELTPEDWLTVVGVVDDVLQREITGDRSAAIYQPYTQVDWPFFLGHMSYVVRSTDTARSIARAMRDVVRSADPSLPVHTIRSMDEVVASTTKEPLFQTWLLAMFSTIALALAAVGVYGVLAYAVTQRRFEIGVRMALGARAADIMTSVLGHTVGLTLAGVLLGGLGALAATRALRGFLFEVTPTDPVTFVGAAALISLAALLTGWLPARRAARVEPIAVLRSE